MLLNHRGEILFRDATIVGNTSEPERPSTNLLLRTLQDWRQSTPADTPRYLYPLYSAPDSYHRLRFQQSQSIKIDTEKDSEKREELQRCVQSVETKVEQIHEMLEDDEQEAHDDGVPTIG